MSFHHLFAILQYQSRRLHRRPAMRFKQYGLYHDITWHDYHEAAWACASALVHLGIQPGDRVGLVAENRHEWLVADMGILAAAAVNVPPHAPLTAKQIAFQLDDAGVRFLFVSNAQQLDKIKAILHGLPQIQGIVTFDPLPEDSLPVPIYSWPAFLQMGRHALRQTEEELHRRLGRLGTDDLATIMYTSGTTGNPKGVMLTHGNLISNASAIHELSPQRPGDCLLSWLPYSHIYARTVDHYRSLVDGVVLCLAESAETVIQNLEDIQPTHMSCVPRFYEKVLAAVADGNKDQTNRRLRNIFGSRIDWLTSGGAPLPLAIAQAYFDAGLLILQGYGLTETSPVISFNRKDCYKLDSVGQPLPNVEVKIADDGEVLTRGPHVMKGYWNNPQATADAIQEGWFHTGDLGRLDDDGFLYITGRKKELLVLSNGKKVVPTCIEGLLVADECIDQAVVYGEGKNFLTALIVPHWDNLRRELDVAKKDKPAEELANDPDVHAVLHRRIDNALADVSSWEHVRRFIVLPTPFSVAADELTVSLKIRRNVILQKYADRLEALYHATGSQ